MNWSGGSPPAPTDVAEFTQAAALRTVANVDTAVTVAGLVMDWGGAVNVDNPLTVGDSNLSFALGTFGGNGAISTGSGDASYSNTTNTTTTTTTNTNNNNRNCNTTGGGGGTNPPTPTTNC